MVGGRGRDVHAGAGLQLLASGLHLSVSPPGCWVRSPVCNFFESRLGRRDVTFPTSAEVLLAGMHLVTASRVGGVQAGVSRSKAVKALKAADGDIVSAIMVGGMLAEASPGRDAAWVLCRRGYACLHRCALSPTPRASVWGWQLV